jgi:hypothetical protein
MSLNTAPGILFIAADTRAYYGQFFQRNYALIHGDSKRKRQTEVAPKRHFSSATCGIFGKTWIHSTAWRRVGCDTTEVTFRNEDKMGRNQRILIGTKCSSDENKVESWFCLLWGYAIWCRSVSPSPPGSPRMALIRRSGGKSEFFNRSRCR